MNTPWGIETSQVFVWEDCEKLRNTAMPIRDSSRVATEYKSGVSAPCRPEE